MKLSKTETIVVNELLKGKRNREIADALFVTEKTIKFHLYNIYKKEQVKSRYELINKYTDRNFEVN